MSLELALAANTAAMIELREAILALHARQLGVDYGLNVVPIETVTEAPAVEDTPAPVERKRGRIKPEIREEAPALVVEAKVEEPAPAPAPAPVTYQEAANAITKLAAAKGRPAAAAVLQQFGVAKLPEAKAEDYAAIKTAAEAALQ